MALIQTLDDVVNRRIQECHETIGNRYHRSVRPVFASIDGTRPEFLGSCILISFSDQKFVVTAAHIIDWCDKHALHIGGTVGTQPVQMLGTIHHTSSPRGRPLDKVDAAFWNITDDAARQLGEVEFISETHFCYNRVNPTGRLYMALGYPLSRNKGSIDHENQGVSPKAWRYTGPADDIPDIPHELGFSSDRHLFLKFDKHSSTLDGSKVSSINPKGVSGGALIDLGNFSEISTYEQGKECDGRLAGMIIEKNKKYKALVAIKIEVVIRAISQQISL